MELCLFSGSCLLFAKSPWVEWWATAIPKRCHTTQNNVFRLCLNSKQQWFLSHFPATWGVAFKSEKWFPFCIFLLHINKIPRTWALKNYLWNFLLVFFLKFKTVYFTSSLIFFPQKYFYLFYSLSELRQQAWWYRAWVGKRHFSVV